MIEFVLIPVLAVAAIALLILWALALWFYGVQLPVRFVRGMVSSYRRGEWHLWHSRTSSSRRRLAAEDTPSVSWCDSRVFARLNAIRGTSE